MRILFYLPANHTYWFDNVVAPMMRCAVRGGAEVHVIVPPLWSPPDPAYAQFATGITAEQLQSCADLPDVRWHIVDGEDHLSLRTVPTAPEKLIDFVRAIDPDYTFCRGADVWTPNAFPGQVRFLMEGEFPPLPPTIVPGGARHWRTPARACRRIVMLGARLYDHGIVPPLDTDQRASLLQQVAPAWHALCNWRSGQGGQPRSLSGTSGIADRSAYPRRAAHSGWTTQLFRGAALPRAI